MRLISKVLLYFSIFLSNYLAFSQEVCNNGVDDDGDGYIDCYDSECSGNAACDSVFFGKPVPTCQYVPPPIGMFSLGEKWRTDVTATPMDNRQTPIIGDIDNDGVPEVIGKDDRAANTLYVFDGITGALERTITSPATDRFLDAVAIGDIDNDGFGEIFIVGENPDRDLWCFEHDGTLKYASTTKVGYTNGDDRWTPSLADFNQDGTAEVYLGNQIFNAVTGAELANGGSANSLGTSASSGTEPFPVAADVLPSAFCADCAGLELVCGNQVYSVNIATGTMTVQVTAPAGLNDGLTSVVDLDFDGDLDAVVTHQSAAGIGVVYAWDLQTSTEIGNTFQIDTASAATEVTTAGGHPNVADFTGDSTLEIGVAGNDVYVVIDYDQTTNTFSELWSREAKDGSQRTGSSVFDFEGDGTNEVVYKDEDTLFIYNGANGTNKATIACPSGTRYDFPPVVDVNADGQTNIICACSGVTGSGGADNGYIIAFEATTDPWLKARRVFNQHTYFNVNVNDDLTIPQVQQTHNLGFPQASPSSFPLNNFLVQATTIDLTGSPTYEAVDAIAQIDSLDLSNCGTGTNQITAHFTVSNLSADRIFPTGSSISIYNGDPFSAGATYVGTTVTDTNIDDVTTRSLSLTFPDQGGTVDLYLLVDDDGNGVIPLSLPSTNIGECDYTNNLDSSIVNACAVSVLSANEIVLEAKRGFNQIDLMWNYQLKEVRKLQLQRSVDGKKWSSIFESEQEQLPTQFVDYKPHKKNFYRLKVFTDQRKYMSKVIKANANGNLISVYPNPSKGAIHVLSQNEAIQSIEVSDVLGRLIDSKHFSNTNYNEILSINKKGVFMVKIFTSESVFYQKIIVE